MSDTRQVNEADLDWFAERDQPETDAIRASEYAIQAAQNSEPRAKCPKCGMTWFSVVGLVAQCFQVDCQHIDNVAAFFPLERVGDTTPNK